jgi:hypothetical protein
MPSSVSKPRTLYDKIWDDHIVYVTFSGSSEGSNAHPYLFTRDIQDDGLALIYIDRWVYPCPEPSVSDVSLRSF